MVRRGMAGHQPSTPPSGPDGPRAASRAGIQPYRADHWVVSYMSSNPYPHYACGIPWAVWANGEDYSTMWPSDLEQWLLMGLSEYVLATRQFELLNETLLTQDGRLITIGQGAWHSYERFRDVVGFGKHGPLSPSSL